jgi:hypothetical protein
MATRGPRVVPLTWAHINSRSRPGWLAGIDTTPCQPGNEHHSANVALRIGD